MLLSYGNLVVEYCVHSTTFFLTQLYTCEVNPAGKRDHCSPPRGASQAGFQEEEEEEEEEEKEGEMKEEFIFRESKEESVVNIQTRPMEGLTHFPGGLDTIAEGKTTTATATATTKTAVVEVAESQGGRTTTRRRKVERPSKKRRTTGSPPSPKVPVKKPTSAAKATTTTRSRPSIVVHKQGGKLGSPPVSTTNTTAEVDLCARDPCACRTCSSKKSANWQVLTIIFLSNGCHINWFSAIQFKD